MAYTVIWYSKDGEVGKTPFPDELSAKKHAAEMFPARNSSLGVVSVEVRKGNGEVVFSHSGKVA